MTGRTLTCRLGDLRDGRATVLRGSEGDIVVVRDGTAVYALDDVCSHAEVPLSAGDVADGEIECWLHGSRFDLRTGEPSGPPACDPVQTFATETSGNADDAVVTIHLDPPTP